METYDLLNFNRGKQLTKRILNDGKTNSIFVQINVKHY